MTILELNFEKSWRGGERQTLYNMQGFRNAGIKAHLLCRKNSPLQSKAVAAGFTVYSFKSVFGVLSFLVTSGKVYDLLHAQTSHILTYCVFTRWFHRKKIIFTRRVNFTPKGFFTRLKYMRTDHIVAISNEIKNTINHFCGRNDIAVISDMVMPQESNPDVAQSLKQDYSGRFIAGTIAAFTEEKDPFTSVEAVLRLYRQRKDFVFLHFGDGPLLDAVQQKITEYGLSAVYILKGFDEKATACLSALDVLVMTSTEEGLGSSVLDAFISKVPVVSTDAGGLKELIQNDRGILCSTGDAGAIAAGMNTFFNDSIKKNNCVDNAFNYVQRYHSMDYITAQYLELLNQ